MAFHVQGKQLDGVSNYVKSGVVPDRSGVLEETKSRFVPIFDAEGNRKKKPYRARGCRGGASRKGRKKASTIGFSRFDSKEAKENNVDSANIGSIYCPGERLAYRSEGKQVLKTQISRPRQAPAVGTLSPVRKGMYHASEQINPASSENHTNEKAPSHKGNSLQTHASEDHHISDHSFGLISSSALTSKQRQEGREQASQECVLLENPLTGAISTTQGLETGKYFNSGKKQPQKQQGSNSFPFGKRDLKRILPPDVCDGIYESNARSSYVFTSAVNAHDQQDSSTSCSHVEGFSFFSVSPRSYLSGKRKNKAQRLF